MGRTKKKPYGIIYKATCSDNGKIYIGLSTRTLEKRKSDHTKSAKYCNTRFYAAIRKHGFENFTWETIDTAQTREELAFMESAWISAYDSTNPEKGYNITTGGYEVMEGRKASKETREKMSKSRIGRKLPPFTDEHRKRLSESHKGKKQTEESNRKRSEARKGKKMEVPGMLGKHHSEETRRKMSEKAMGRKQSPEARQKMSEAKKGKSPANKGKPNPYKGIPRSAETIARMREAAKRRWEKKFG